MADGIVTINNCAFLEFPTSIFNLIHRHVNFITLIWERCLLFCIQQRIFKLKGFLINLQNLSCSVHLIEKVKFFNWIVFFSFRLRWIPSESLAAHSQMRRDEYLDRWHFASSCIVTSPERIRYRSDVKLLCRAFPYRPRRPRNASTSEIPTTHNSVISNSGEYRISLLLYQRIVLWLPSNGSLPLHVIRELLSRGWGIRKRVFIIHIDKKDVSQTRQMKYWGHSTKCITH